MSSFVLLFIRFNLRICNCKITDQIYQYLVIGRVGNFKHTNLIARTPTVDFIDIEITIKFDK